MKTTRPRSRRATPARARTWALLSSRTHRAVLVLAGVPPDTHRGQVLALLSPTLARFAPWLGERLTLRKIDRALAGATRGSPRIEYSSIARERRVTLKLSPAAYALVARASGLAGGRVGSLQTWAASRLEAAARQELDKRA